MNIGYVVSKVDLNVDYNELTVVNTLSDIELSKPTIIVDWRVAKELFPEDFSIIRKKITDNIYWTYAPTERLGEYEKDLKWFLDESYKKLTDRVSYILIDPLVDRYSTVKEMLSFLDTDSYSCGVMIDDMMYFYTNNMVYGIDINVIDFFGLDRTRFINKSSGMCSVFLSDSEIFNICKECLIVLDSNKKYTPYIYYLKNGEKRATTGVICI